MTTHRSGEEAELHPVRLVCLLLGLITLLAYLPVYSFEFSFYDDTDYVTGNKMVQAGLSWSGIKWAFTSFHASNWHPVTWLSHMLDCQLFGLNAGAQHLVNVLFHAANAVLLLLFLYRTTRLLWPAAFAAAAFAWHPLRVESVAWIAERKDVLSTFFGLLALGFYARYAQAQAGDGKRNASDASRPTASGTKDYLLALGLFAVGLMAKPMLVTWPFLMLVLDYWPLHRFGGSDTTGASAAAGPRFGARLRQLIREKWPFFLLAAGGCVITLLAQRSQAMLSLGACPLGLRVSNALVAYSRYLLKAAWPVPLTISYPFPRQYPLWQVAGATLLLATISAVAWGPRRKAPYLLAGWLWYLGTLVPVVGLVQAGSESMAERYTYIPMMGIAVAVAFGARAVVLRLAWSRAKVWTAAVALLASWLALTEHQLQFWRNPETLFRHAIAVSGNNMVAHQVLGAYLYSQGREQQALDEFRAALRIGDTAFVTPAEKQYGLRGHLALAHDYEKRGQFADALAQYGQAIGLEPANVEAHNDLGNLLADLGRHDEAMIQYREALRLQPDAPLPHENLGTLLEDMGRPEEALAQFEEAARLDPRAAQPYYLMGRALLKQGKDSESISRFRQALRVDTNHVPSLTWLARVLAADPTPRLRDGEEALRLAERANALTEGRRAIVLDTLAMACAETGRFPEARRTAQAALDLEQAAGHTALASNLQRRLHLYESGQPCRESFAGQPNAPDAPAGPSSHQPAPGP